MTPQEKRNVARGQRAAKALAFHSKLTKDIHADLQTKMYDIVADLIHLAHQRGIPFDAVLRVANDHFRTETSGVDM